MLQIESNQNQQPNLHVILLIASQPNGDKHYFQWIGVATSAKEAGMKAIDHIKEKLPTLWQIGINNGGFKLISNNSFTKEVIITMFEQGIEKPPDPTFEIVEVEEPETEKTKLMKRLIGQGDIQNLNEYKDQLTEYEYKYIKEQIKYATNRPNPNS